MKKVLKSNQGFTLIELLVVLVVIGILIGLILPNTLKAINQAHDKECASNLRSIDTALQMCFSEKKRWADCDTIAKLTDGAFLEVAPVCPFNQGYTIEDYQGGKRTNKLEHFAAWPPTGPHLAAGGGEG